MNAHNAGTVRVAIGRGSDFFGPYATEAAMMGTRVFGRALAGKYALAIGNTDRLHTYTFIDDFARGLVTLGEREEALGKAWHMPSSPAVKTAEFVNRIYAQLGKRTKLATLPRFAISLLAAFDENARELREMLYQFERDFVMDSSRFETAFGERPTALDEGIRQTLNWYRNRPPY